MSVDGFRKSAVSEPPAVPRSQEPRHRAPRLGAALLAALLAAAASAGPYDHGLLWRLDRPGLAPSYVFGTLHSADPRVTVLPALVADAFASCRTLAIEIYVTDALEGDFFDAMQFEDGRRLEPLLGADAYARLKLALGDAAPAEEVLARTKPWAALLRVVTPRATADEATLDQTLFASARARRMTIIGLEWLEEQIAALDQIPLDTQLAILRHAIDHRASLDAQLEPTVKAWLARDLAALSRLNDAAAAGDAELARHYAVLTRHLVDDRSALMAYRLFLPLRAGGVFVAVGASHLSGRHGLLALLREQGYRLRRVY